MEEFAQHRDDWVVRASLRGAEETPPATPLDVSTLPGAEVVVDWAGETPGDAWFRVGCVTASSSRWAPGAQDLLFPRATHLAIKMGELESAALGTVPDAAAPSAHSLVQNLAGPATRKHEDGHAAVAHRIAFSEDDAIIACTGVCFAAEPDRCAESITTLRIEGALGEEPPGALWVRGTLWAATHPQAAGIGLAIAGAVLVGAIIAWRPRPAQRPGPATRRSARRS